MTGIDHLAIGLIILLQLRIIWKLHKLDDDIDTCRLRCFRICENMSNLGRIFVKKGWLPKRDSRDPEWNWGDGR